MKNIIQVNLKIIYIIFTLLFLPPILLAQDKIHKTDNTVIEAKVTEINEQEVKYKKFTNQSGPLYTIYKNDILWIVYENGDKETFNTQSLDTKTRANTDLTDSLSFIESFWGIKLENATEIGGSVKVTELKQSSIFKPFTPLGKLYIVNVNTGEEIIRVTNTSELSRVLFETYNKGISKVQLSSGSKRMSGLSSFTYDAKGFDIGGFSKFNNDSEIKKLSIEESKIAGNTVSKIYHPGQNWVMQGFCSGMLFGLPSVALMGIASVFPPVTPVAPPNVDAGAWSKAYKKRIQKKRLLSGVIGSVIGSVLIIGAVSAN